jgi:hypothetical protein
MSTSLTSLLTLSLDIYFTSCMPASMRNRASISKSRLLAMPSLSEIVAASTGRPTGSLCLLLLRKNGCSCFPWVRLFSSVWSVVAYDVL